MDISKYFDWAATSPADETIWRESLEIAMEHYGNPSAVHNQGQKARIAFEAARTQAAKVLNVKTEEVFFTSGGTESDHIPLLSLLNRTPGTDGCRGKIILSGIEHPALREQSMALKKCGLKVITVNPDRNGFIQPESIIEKLSPDTLFVTVMAANNETGCIQDIYTISDRLTEATKGKRRPHLHVDCVQAAGKIKLDLSYPGIDSAALSAHKICGPRGIGILVLKKQIEPFLTGGGQEKNIRSGTENLFGATAFAKCLEKYYFNQEKFLQQSENTKEFIKELLTLPNCTMVPAVRNDLSEDIQKRFSPFVVQASFKGIPGNVMVRALDSKGFCISTGSACSAKKQSRPILAAMNVSRELQDTAVRFSFGPLTKKEDIQCLLEAVREINKDFC